MKIKLPTWQESNAREQEGTATPLEIFISNWEPAPPGDDSFRLMLERAVGDITARLRAENQTLMNNQIALMNGRELEPLNETAKRH